MPTTTITKEQLSPKNVLDVLSRHILVDGYHVVMDMERSQGSYLYDARSDRPILDFFSCFATIPVGYNHPKMNDPEFREALMEAALTKPSTSDIYTEHFARFVETFSNLAIPPTHSDHMFFVEGGTLAIENTLKTAFDWKIRKNLAKGKGEKGTKVLHFQNAFHGRSGYSLSMTNTADPRKTQYFPKFDWPRLSCPRLRFPITEDVLRDVAAAEEAVEREIRAACAASPDDIAALILEPIQGEGGDNHFRPELFRRLRALADELDFLLIFDEVQTGVGLTGSMWAWQQMGVEPDMFAFGKKTQVCGFAANHRIDEVPDNVFKVSSRINSTWGGNLVDMIRCARYMEIIAEDNLIENARVVGEYLQAPTARARDGVPGRHDERPRPRPLHRLRSPGQGDARPDAGRVPRERHDGPGLRRQRHPLPAAPGPVEGRGGRGRPEAAAGDRGGQELVKCVSGSSQLEPTRTRPVELVPGAPLLLVRRGLRARLLADPPGRRPARARLAQDDRLHGAAQGPPGPGGQEHAAGVVARAALPHRAGHAARRGRRRGRAVLRARRAWTGRPCEAPPRRTSRRAQLKVGGSTITQQLAKNLYLSPARTPWRKLREVAIARPARARRSRRSASWSST